MMVLWLATFDPRVIMDMAREYWALFKNALFGLWGFVWRVIDWLPGWVQYVFIGVLILFVLWLLWWGYTNVDAWKSRI